MGFFDRIEPDTRRYLKKIFLTLVYSVTWLFANVVIGLIFEFAYLDEGVAAKNIIYYLVSATFLFLLIRWLIITWRGSDKEPDQAS